MGDSARTEPRHVFDVRVQCLFFEILRGHVRHGGNDGIVGDPPHRTQIDAVYRDVEGFRQNGVHVDEITHSSKGVSTMKRRRASTFASTGSSSAACASA